MARQCVFCGDGPVTNEHVVPQWLERAIEDESVLSDFRRAYYYQDVSGRKRKVGPANPISVNQVCARCNGGWMNEIEKDASQLVPRMIEGTTVILDHKKRSTLSRWFGLKTLTMRYCAGKNVPPLASMLQYYYQHHGPGPDCTIWLGCFEPDLSLGKQELISWSNQRLTLVPRGLFANIAEFAQRDVLVGNFQIGRLLAKVLWIPNAQLNSGKPIGMERIWPEPTFSPIWPGQRLTGSGLQQVNAWPNEPP